VVEVHGDLGVAAVRHDGVRLETMVLLAES